MKKTYVTPELDVIEFNNEDVITEIRNKAVPACFTV